MKGDINFSSGFASKELKLDGSDCKTLVTHGRDAFDTLWRYNTRMKKIRELVSRGEDYHISDTPGSNMTIKFLCSTSYGLQWFYWLA